MKDIRDAAIEQALPQLWEMYRDAARDSRRAAVADERGSPHPGHAEELLVRSELSMQRFNEALNDLIKFAIIVDSRVRMNFNRPVHGTEERND